MTKIELLRLKMLRFHTDEDVELFDDLVQSARCALADLEGSQQAHQSCDRMAHDWDAHQQSIDELSGVLLATTDGEE